MIPCSPSVQKESLKMNLFPTPTRRTPLLGWESLTHTIQAMQKREGLFPYAILVVLVGFAWTFLLTPGVGLGITFMGMVLLGLFTPIDKLTIPAIRANLETLLLSGDPPTLAQALCVLSTGVITSEQEKQLKLKLVSILQGINPESVPILTDREKAK